MTTGITLKSIQKQHEHNNNNETKTNFIDQAHVYNAGGGRTKLHRGKSHTEALEILNFHTHRCNLQHFPQVSLLM